MENFNDQEISIFTNLDFHLASGRDGYYSLALGRIVESEEREEEIMKERGFVKESVLNKNNNHDDYFDYMLSLLSLREKEINRLTNIYNKALADGLSEEEAMAMAYNTEDALSGNLDKLFSSNLKDMEKYNGYSTSR
jgi:hypothetical protein